MCESYINVLSSFGRKAAPEFAIECEQTSASFQQSMVYLTEHASLDDTESIIKYWRDLCIELHKMHKTSTKLYQPLLEHLYQILSKKAEFSIEDCEDLNSMTEDTLEMHHQEFEDKMKYRNSIDEIFDLLG